MQILPIGSLAEHVEPPAKWNRNWPHISIWQYHVVNSSPLKKYTFFLVFEMVSKTLMNKEY
jgi:hypothetical protein